jgi:hypothetical protein
MFDKHLELFTQAELEAYIYHLVDDGIPETWKLDYKREISLTAEKDKLEIAKDITSFANTAGGTLIYGIAEQKVNNNDDMCIPVEPIGIDPIPNLISKIENILYDTVSPRLQSLVIKEVPYNRHAGKVVYIVWHPESPLAPHMVYGYGDYRYYRRGQLRTIKMNEQDIRDKYVQGQHLRDKVQEFMDSDSVTYLCQHFAGRFSQVTVVPLLLIPERLDFSTSEMRLWLASNQYPSTDFSERPGKWSASLNGALSGVDKMPVFGSEATRRPVSWVELHRNGSLNALWETNVQGNDDTKFLDLKELKEFKTFLNFAKDFMFKINYSGPLIFRFSIASLHGVDFQDKSAVFPNDAFKAEFIEDAVRFVSKPQDVLIHLITRLFQAYGEWEIDSSLLQQI